MKHKIFNKSNRNKIQKEYLSLIQEVESEIKKKIKNVRCLCLRGSVSKGEAKLFTSDIDFVLITDSESSSEEKNFISALSIMMEKKYPFVTDVDITIITFSNLLKTRIPNELIFNLKTSSCILFGEDVKKYIPEFYIDEELVQYLYSDFKEKITNMYNIFKYKKKLKYNGQIKPFSFWCRWTMRMIIRSTNALTLLKEKKYNSNLLDCFISINKIHPEISRDIQQAIKWDLNPTNNTKEILDFLDKFLPEYLELIIKETKKPLP